MRSSFFITFIIATAFWQAVEANPIMERTHIKRDKSCTVDNMDCERIAIAKFDGKSGITGHIEFLAHKGTSTVKVLFHVRGLETQTPVVETGYSYHVHVNPIGASGNCADALGHFNPTNVPNEFKCDPKDPKACQVGDLSGKHGTMAAGRQDVRRSYVDDQLRFDQKEFSMVGRSVVIHGKDAVRLACANIIFYGEK